MALPDGAATFQDLRLDTEKAANGLHSKHNQHARNSSLDENAIVTSDDSLDTRSTATSSMDEFLANRRTSIAFNPEVKLDSGHQQHMDEPLEEKQTKA